MYATKHARTHTCTHTPARRVRATLRPFTMFTARFRPQRFPTPRHKPPTRMGLQRPSAGLLDPSERVQPTVAQCHATLAQRHATVAQCHHAYSGPAPCLQWPSAGLQDPSERVQRAAAKCIGARGWGGDAAAALLRHLQSPAAATVSRTAWCRAPHRLVLRPAGPSPAAPRLCRTPGGQHRRRFRPPVRREYSSTLFRPPARREYSSTLFRPPAPSIPASACARLRVPPRRWSRPRPPPAARRSCRCSSRCSRSPARRPRCAAALARPRGARRAPLLRTPQADRRRPSGRGLQGGGAGGCDQRHRGAVRARGRPTRPRRRAPGAAARAARAGARQRRCSTLG